MHPLRDSGNLSGLFSRLNGCCLRMGFASNHIRSYLQATEDVQLVANRYIIG